MNENFRVDLRGLLTLLSQHLYSSPAVYLRELMQNGVDAITARRLVDPAAPAGRIDIRTPASRGDDVLEVADNGIGLTADEMVELLATIGNSSKRDQDDFGRAEFLGQFGIGLLSTFLACDELEVLSRSARTPDAPTVRWRASARGTYTVDDAPEPLPEPGTRVLLRRGPQPQLMTDRFVLDTARHYGSMLAPEVVVRTATGAEAIGDVWPWRMDSHEAAEWCRSELGFTPMARFPLEVPVAGVRGMAFVDPQESRPGTNAGHRAYLKGMLLGDQVRDLLPEWCFFVRCVFDISGLRPTASREALFDDDLLADVRDELGRQVVAWLTDVASLDEDLMDRFMQVHHEQIVALALHDTALVPLAKQWFRFHTTSGDLTIDQFRARHPQVCYAATNDQFRGLQAVATAQNIGVINGGYTNVTELLRRFAEHDGFEIEQIDPSQLALVLGTLSDDDERRVEPLVRAVVRELAGRDVDVLVRRFEPSEVPSLFLPDPDIHTRHLRETSTQLGGLFGDLMGAIEQQREPDDSRPAYVLNARNRLVESLVDLAARGEDELAGAIGGGLYAQALLAGNHPMGHSDQMLLSTTFMKLIRKVLR